MSEIVHFRIMSIDNSFHIVIPTKKIESLFSQIVRNYHIPSQIATVVDYSDQLFQSFRVFNSTPQNVLPLLYFVFLVNWNHPFVLIGHDCKANLANLSKTVVEKYMFVSPVDV